MSSSPSANSLQVKRFIKAPPERVFAAWTTPAQLKNWFCPGDVSVMDAKLDLRVGGAYRLLISACEQGEMVIHGTYREIASPTKLVFTWQFEDDPDWENVVSVVTVEMLAKDQGTEVSVTHEGLPSGESCARHEHGWNGSLDKLSGRASAVTELNGPGQFSWNELLTSDVAGAGTFYSQLFGWEPAPMPGGMPYTIFKKDEWYVGGMMARPMPEMPPHWLAYVTVKSADASAEQVTKLGGTVCKPPFDIPNVGRIAIIQDPQGAFLGLFQPFC
jgi:predicted enzyme related to lactoylglutathione lyase/uncharacterized protein YndB with AHSA1/START domain